MEPQKIWKKTTFQTLLAILNFAGDAVLQTVSGCPRKAGAGDCKGSGCEVGDFKVGDCYVCNC